MIANLDTPQELVLGEQIHRSHHSRVFRATWAGAEVVVKKAIVRREENLAAFEEEVRLLSLESLRDHVVRPLAVIRAAPHYSFVLPLLHRGSLDDLLHGVARDDRSVVEPPLCLGLVVCLSSDSAVALAATHAAGIVHRDIKTANVLVDEDWKAWLSDFGSARQGDPQERASTAPTGGFHKLVMDGTTMRYTAPEVLRNSPATEASDVFALGVMMAEIVTGRRPYDGLQKLEADMHTVLDATYSQQSLAAAITNEGLRPNLPGASVNGASQAIHAGALSDLTALIKQCWDENPARRPTASQCARAFVELVEGHGIDISTSARQHLGVAFEEKRATFLSRNSKSTATPGPPMLLASLPPPRPTHGRNNVPSVRCADDGGLHTAGFATAGMRGADKMEDRHVVLEELACGRVWSTMCVFDGHGGASAAEHASVQLPPLVQRAVENCPGSGQEDSATRAADVCAAFEGVDERFRSQAMKDLSGCTAIALALWPAELAGEQKSVWRAMVANAGDCRAILGRRIDAGAVHLGRPSFETVRLSSDHNSESTAERSRVESCGGKFQRTADGRLRVQGHIQVTRSLGDRSMKPFGVCATPEVTEFTLEPPRDAFVVVATDGVWDVCSDEEVVAIVAGTARKAELAAKRIGTEAIARGSTDNVTVVVCFLPGFSA